MFNNENSTLEGFRIELNFDAYNILVICEPIYVYFSHCQNVTILVQVFDFFRQIYLHKFTSLKYHFSA